MKKIAIIFLMFFVMLQTSRANLMHPLVDMKARQELSVHNLNGFEDATTVAISSDAGNPPTITLTFTGTVFWWSDGVRYSDSGTDAIQIDDTTGVHYLYYDGATLTKVANPSHAAISAVIENKAIACIIYWNTTPNTTPILAVETHGVRMSGATHHWLHDNVGSSYLEGLSISGYTLNTATDAAITFEVEDGGFNDEDIKVDIVDGDPANQYEQQLNGGDASLPVLYKLTDGTWVEQAASTLPYIVDGSDTLMYMDTDNSWTQTAVTGVRFMLYWMVATNDWQYPVKMVQGSQEYLTAAAAVEGAETEIIDWGAMPSEEFIVLYQFTMQAAIGENVDGKITNITDFRFANITGASATTQDHGSTTGLADDDHKQYILHALADAKDDFLVGSGPDAFIKKTLAEVAAILETTLDHDSLQGGHQDVKTTASPTWENATLTSAIPVLTLNGQGGRISTITAAENGNNLIIDTNQGITLSTDGIEQMTKGAVSSNPFDYHGNRITGISKVEADNVDIFSATALVRIGKNVNETWEVSFDDTTCWLVHANDADGDADHYTNYDMDNDSAGADIQRWRSDGVVRMQVHSVDGFFTPLPIVTTNTVTWSGGSSTATNNHIADNSQAHTDYMLNSGDTVTGTYIFGNAVVFNDGIEVTGTASFLNDIDVTDASYFDAALEVNGKLTVNGGTDPPYVLIDLQTKEQIVMRCRQEIPLSKAGGKAIVNIIDDERIKWFIPLTGGFYGEKVDENGWTVPTLIDTWDDGQICYNPNSTTVFRYDRITDTIKTTSETIYTHSFPEDKILNRDTGVITDKP